LAPPTLFFIVPNATAAPGQHVRFLSKGATDVTLQGLIQLSPTNPVAGYGGVVFTIVNPDGTTGQVTSNIAFMFPGNSTTVSGVYIFPIGLVGTYQLFVTMLRCATPSSCIQGQTVNGLRFKVK
jgi:hypothetical protein